VQVAKENADVIIMDDNFRTIVNVAKWGRAVYINIQKFVQFQLTVNVVALVINFVSACFTGAVVRDSRLFRLSNINMTILYYVHFFFIFHFQDLLP
jgi:magnesium-transporting ATPase (P-type)